MSRYARQMILPEIGEKGQAALQAARVLIIGAGGLGCPVLHYLVGAGVGQMTVIDPDQVSLSNLHRQVLFTQSDVGQSKAKTACNRLSELNSDVTLTAIEARFDPTTAPDLVNTHDLVLDCADSFAASYVASDLCLSAGVPFVSASVLGRQGYVGGFCGGAPSLRAVFPDLPDTLASCDTAGVMGPVVGMLGATQAQFALAILLATHPAALGQMMNIDMATYRSSSFRFDTAPEPQNPLRFIAPTEITKQDFVVELRGKDEAPIPVTPDAHRHVVADFTIDGPRPVDHPRTVLTCRSGLRAWTAATRLQSYNDTEIVLVAMGDPIS